MRVKPSAGRASYCRIAHGLGRSAVRGAGISVVAERWALYGAWAAVVTAVAGGRALELTARLRHVPLPFRFELGLGGVAGISPLLAVIEATLAFKRFHDGRCRLRGLEQKLASRPSAPVPVGDAKGDMRVAACLSHARCRVRLKQARHRHKRTTLAMARDGIIQLPGIANGTVSTAGLFVGKVAAALPWLGVVGNALGIGMGIAHIVTGLKQRRLAKGDMSRLRSDRRELDSRLMRMARVPRAATSDAQANEKLMQLQGLTPCVVHACLTRSYEAASTECSRANARIVYGVISAVASTAALVLTVTALAGLIAATGGIAVGLAGALLGAAWLCYAPRRLQPAEQVEPSPALGAALDQELSDADGADGAAGGTDGDAAAAKALQQACSTWASERQAQCRQRGGKDLHKIDHSYRFIAAAHLFDCLRHEGDGAAAVRRQATALARALGADDELIAAWQGASNDKEYGQSLKLLVYYLEGNALSAGGAHLS